MQQKITRIPISIPKTTIGVGRAAGASGGAAEQPLNLRNDSKSNMEASGVCAEASGGYVDLSRPSKDKTDRYFCGRGYDEADSTSLQRPCQQPVVPPQTLNLSFIAEYRLFISLVWRCVYAIAMEGAYNHDAVGEREVTRICQPLICEDQLKVYQFLRRLYASVPLFHN